VSLSHRGFSLRPPRSTAAGRREPSRGNGRDGRSSPQGSRASVWEHTSQQDVARTKCPVVNSIGHFVLISIREYARQFWKHTPWPVRRQSLSTILSWTLKSRWQNHERFRGCSTSPRVSGQKSNFVRRSVRAREIPLALARIPLARQGFNLFPLLCVQLYFPSGHVFLQVRE
jgi:hypothetical protein